MLWIIIAIIIIFVIISIYYKDFKKSINVGVYSNEIEQYPCRIKIIRPIKAYLCCDNVNKTVFTTSSLDSALHNYHRNTRNTRDACNTDDNILNKNTFDNQMYILKKGKDIKIINIDDKGNKLYLTLSGYTSVYNTEYPVLLDSCNKPIFNTFRIKKYKNKDKFIYLKTKHGFYLGYDLHKNTLIFTKNKSKATVLKLKFCD